MALGSNNNVVEHSDDDHDEDGSNPFDELDYYLEAFDFYTCSYEAMEIEAEKNKYKICQRAYYNGKAYLQLMLSNNIILAKKSLEHTITAFTAAKDFLLQDDPTNNSLGVVDAILDLALKLQLVYIAVGSLESLS
jgi:hypothetical protein